MKIITKIRRFISMKILPHLLCCVLFVATHAASQSNDGRWVIPEAVYSTAFKIEVMKNGGDCTVISYLPQEYNETMTPRDDRNLGVQYLVSGKDCQQLFAETFSTFKGRENEAFAFIPAKTLVLDSFEYIHMVTTDEVVGEGCTKVFVTSLWSDHNTPMSHVDDIYLGTDMFTESADPSQIIGPLDLSSIKLSFEDELDVFSDIPGLLTNIESRSYYKLKEMQVNKNHIVEKLRADGILKDITPEMKTEKLKVKRFRMEN